MSGWEGRRRAEPDVAPVLGDLRVLELSDGIAGPFCARLLADFGAEVIKVEQPGGDWTRGVGPFPDGAADPERSGTFLALNANKSGVVIDVETAEGAALVRELAAGAHVVVESWPPGHLDRVGLGAAALLADHPALVVTSITPFGQWGPYVDWATSEIVAYAMGGPMSSTGHAGREPLKLVGNVVQHQAGATALTATLGALHHAEETGEGQHVDVAIFETQQGSIDRRLTYLLTYAYSGLVSERGDGATLPFPNGVYPTADGHVMVATIGPYVRRMAETVRDPAVAAVAADPAVVYRDPDAKQAMEAAVERWFAARTGWEAMTEAQRNAWPVARVNTFGELVSDPHFRARGFFVEADHPAAGRVVHCGAPWRMPGGFGLRAAAPLLGQHTDDVLATRLGRSPDDIARLREAGVVA